MPSKKYGIQSKEGMKLKRKLSNRQKALMKNLRARGMSIKLYKRSGKPSLTAKCPKKRC